MKKWFRRSLKNQLIVFILMVVLIPTTLLGLFSYFTTVQVSKERAAISGESSIDQLQDALEFIINDVENMSVFLIGNQSVQDYLNQEGRLVAQQRDIYGFLSNLAFPKNYIEKITIIPLNGNSNISTTLITEDQEIDYADASEGKWWSVKEKNQTLDGEKEMITLTRPIRSTTNYELLGYLSISLDQEAVTQYLESIDLEWNGSVLILSNGEVIAENKYTSIADLDISKLNHNINNWNSDESFVYESGKEKATVFSRAIPSVDWNLVGVIPFQEYSSQNRYFLWLTIFFVTLAAILVASLVIFFISKVFRPLTILTESIQKSNPGENLNTVDSYTDNEIGELIRSYNGLNNRITALMDEVKQNESIKRQLDLQALQSQINPHFLYNTLASVHWIALSRQENDISKVVSHLSDFLRFSLNKGNEYCTVEQEVGNLIHYLEILKIRYPNSFHLELSIAEDIKQHSTLKLVLQPLIENSINHGFFSVEDYYGVIQVSATEQDGYMHFEVKDNGTGMTEEKLNEIKEQFINDLNTEMVVGKNYGLRNVNMRLILHFGTESGLNIDSEINQGTIVRFAIPIKG
ncbi:sensor histidine kinase [Oceanobacillus oncorhynchi subsp. oncorhynchi]|uniref:cache domain-containing sensor histidine kinase n=1 Tax=Oceanobacillus oncorhynchi TaxID=545501 RepID=UPI0031DF5A7E